MFRKLKKDPILYKAYLEEKERKQLLSIQEETELNVKSCFLNQILEFYVYSSVGFEKRYSKIQYEKSNLIRLLKSYLRF